jgi:putative hydrolase
MSGNLPFGFQPPDDEGGNNPLGGFDLSGLGSALESLGRMLQAGGEGPVNWDMAKQIARQHDVQKADPGVTAQQRSAAEDAVRLANTWLDGSSSFAASNAAAICWSRGDWVDQTLPAWQRIITPVAEHVQSTMAGMLGGQGMPEGIPGLDSDQLQQMIGPLSGMAKQMGSAMFATQVGQGLGTLSGEVLCSSDIGIPLTPDGRPSLLPGNTSEFADGLGVERQEVLLYVALRECAHQRLFTHVPWLRSRLEAAVDAYARGIHVDTGQMEEAFGKIDPNNPASIQDALSGGMFEPKDTPEQQAALARLETLLALVEGWVDHVVTEAAGDRMPLLSRLSEAMRRRRAAGGPAEKTFANLVGLELRPRRLREASQYWAKVAPGDSAARDARWEHPDLLPTAEDLDDLEGFFERSAASEAFQIPDSLADEPRMLTDHPDVIPDSPADTDDTGGPDGTPDEPKQ